MEARTAGKEAEESGDQNSELKKKRRKRKEILRRIVGECEICEVLVEMLSSVSVQN